MERKIQKFPFRNHKHKTAVALLNNRKLFKIITIMVKGGAENPKILMKIYNSSWIVRKREIKN